MKIARGADPSTGIRNRAPKPRHEKLVRTQAEPMTIAAKMANSIESANTLHKTYAPVELSAVRAADAARLRGRKRIRDGNE
jgi:hypothetical protein